MNNGIDLNRIAEGQIITLTSIDGAYGSYLRRADSWLSIDGTDFARGIDLPTPPPDVPAQYNTERLRKIIDDYLLTVVER